MSDIFKRKQKASVEPEKEAQKKDLAKDRPTEEQSEKKEDKRTEIQKQIKKEDKGLISELIKEESLRQTEKQSKEEVGDLSSKRTSQIMKDGLEVESKQKTKQLYNQTIELVKEILRKGLNTEPIEGEEIKVVVEKLIDQLALGNFELIALTRNSTPENYLYAHSTNVCILSIVLGLGLNYNKKRLIELGVAGILYDIGMIKVCDISQKPAKLTDEEYDKISKHPIFGAEILGLLKDISQIVIYVTQEHHECVNGTGYPKALKGKQINEYTKIISITDAYEALTHPRAYRDKILPFDAIRTILRDKEHFDSNILKVLIERIGIYPIGSWVELSSGEVGKVIRINKLNPLRPIVDIVLGSQGQKVTESKIADLTKTPNLNIKKPLEDSEIKSET